LRSFTRRTQVHTRAEILTSECLKCRTNLNALDTLRQQSTQQQLLEVQIALSVFHARALQAATTQSTFCSCTTNTPHLLLQPAQGSASCTCARSCCNGCRAALHMRNTAGDACRRPSTCCLGEPMQACTHVPLLVGQGNPCLFFSTLVHHACSPW